MTNKTTWIIIGTTLGVGALATGGYFLWKNQKSKVSYNPLIKGDEFVNDLSSKNSNNYNDSLPLLIDKIWVIENTPKFKDPKADGRDDFIAKSMRVDREMQRRGLTFWRTEKEYGLDFLIGGNAIRLPIT